LPLPDAIISFATLIFAMPLLPPLPLFHAFTPCHYCRDYAILLTPPAAIIITDYCHCFSADAADYAITIRHFFLRYDSAIFAISR
jgi:hypothetical protein